MNLIHKFYDAECAEVGGNYVVKEENKEAKTIIECECGTHLLQLHMDADIYTNRDGSIQVHQSYYLAMFGYENAKRTFWQKLRIALKMLTTGEIYDDQIILQPSEAVKLANFITNNLIETQK